MISTGFPGHFFDAPGRGWRYWIPNSKRLPRHSEENHRMVRVSTAIFNRDRRDQLRYLLIDPFFWSILVRISFRQHKDDAPIDDEDPNYQEKKRTQEVPRWDAEFLKVDQGTLFGKSTSFDFLLLLSRSRNHPRRQLPWHRAPPGLCLHDRCGSNPRQGPRRNP